jgi:5-oxopent-3-ene-1,2,5-tricarboxylate decarboxylase / 2-hydroxyhepta-2,4-diene-1,7-dioate isomerase
MKFKTIYGSLMQHRLEYAAVGEAMHAKPYLAPPRAPVLYIKPSNTFSSTDSVLTMPSELPWVARACLGLIFKNNWPLAHTESALAAIESIANGGCDCGVLVDLSLPQSNYYRPPVKLNALDGSLALPFNRIACQDGLQLDALELQTWVNGQCVHRYSSADWLRNVFEQACAVGEFIAFEAGDVLMMGCPPDMPQVQSGDVVQARCLCAGTELRSITITLSEPT